MRTQKLAIIDSGLGGMNYLYEFIQNRYELSIYYQADKDNMPWGNKSVRFLNTHLEKIVEKCLNKEIQNILLACNTATLNCIDNLRQKFPCQFFGIEPFVNYININQSTDKKFALLVTESSAKSEKFKNLKKRLDPQNKIDLYPLKNLARLIESLVDTELSEIKNQIDQELSMIAQDKYDSIILGCTHYPIINDYLQEFFNAKMVDPTQNVIAYIENQLDLKKNISTPKVYYSTDPSREWKSIDIKGVLKSSKYEFFKFGSWRQN